MKRLSWCVCVLLSGCGGPGGGTRVAYGPDAAVAASVDDPGELQWMVSRPVFDRGLSGQPTVDPRTLIALEAPHQALWLVAARVDADAGLRLSGAMEATLRSAPVATSHRLTLRMVESSSGHCEYRAIRGGRWRWNGQIESAGELLYTMSLIDAGGGEVALVEMDVATARNLHEHLSRTIRTAPARFAGGNDLEQTP